QVNPDAPDEYGYTPLHVTISWNKYGNTSLHVAVSYDNIYAINKIYTMKLLLSDPRVNPNAPGEDGYTPLHVAISWNNIYAMKLLLADPLVDPNAQNENGYTPLHIAACNDNIEA